MIQVVEFATNVPPVGRRRAPDDVNGRLFEAIMRHRHYVLRSENAALVNILAPLQDALAEIVRVLKWYAEREDALSDFGRVRRVQLIEIERRIRATIASANLTTRARTDAALREFVESEVLISRSLLRRELPGGVFFDLATGDVLGAQDIVTAPFGGMRWADRMARNYGLLIEGMLNAVATSVALGETFDQAAQRMGTVVGGTVGTQSLVRIARTEIQRVATQTAMRTYRANSAVVKAITIVETLDSRTCILCATKDGDVHPVGTVGPTDLPPYHPNCRGFPSPVVRSLEELGLDPLDFPEGTRASMNGQVPASVTYQEWFARQGEEFQSDMLGPARFALWRAGQITLEEMVRDNRILPIAQLAVRSLG